MPVLQKNAPPALFQKADLSTIFSTNRMCAKMWKAAVSLFHIFKVFFSQSF